MYFVYAPQLKITTATPKIYRYNDYSPESSKRQ